MLCFKTAVRSLVLCSGVQIPAAETTVFLLCRCSGSRGSQDASAINPIEILPFTFPKAPSVARRNSL